MLGSCGKYQEEPKLGCTVMLISEASPDRLMDGSYDEGYLSDGIITLKMQVVRDVETQRRIRTQTTSCR